MAARLVSVNVGLPRDVSWHGQTVHTGIWKNPVPGRVMARKLNLDGDGQGDLGGHGGVNRAAMVYQLDSYRYWEHQLSRSNFSYGQFGENFTVEGLPDDEVCIGDRYRIGAALFEVSQPRVTCYRLGIRMDEPRMAALVVGHHRPGFYFRVLEEGEVGAGDEIVKVADGPERMTVAEIDALLYLGGVTREQLERALRIPVLSAGWRGSLEAILQKEISGSTMTGNPGLTDTAPPPAWTGFRSLKVSRIRKESESVTSLTLEPGDGKPLAAALPGQYVVLRMKPDPDGPALLRNYSLSDLPATDHYRVSVKQEQNGRASTYLDTQIRVGDSLDVAAPRGSFTLNPQSKSVVLLSAGVGVTPVLAMLHSLAAAASPADVWWLFGARNGEDHPFAEEAGKLIKALPRGKGYVAYSQPNPQDRLGADYDAAGRITRETLEKLDMPRDADFYLCGPTSFMQDLTQGLIAWGVAQAQVHSEIFGAAKAITPGIVNASHAPPHVPQGASGPGPRVSFARSNLTACWDPMKYSSLLDFAEACDVPVRWACRTGVCHTCESGLISGSVRYEPEPLEPPAQGNLLICCARPTTDVALDL